MALIYNRDKYKEYISEETIKKIEKDRHVKCLFGGAFGTLVYNIGNNASDFDFYLIIDKKDSKEDAYRYFDEKTLNDIYMLDWNYIRTSSTSYLSGIKKYPSILHRDQLKIPAFNGHRDDYTSQLLFEILYSDYIWDSNFLQNNIDTILYEMSYIGILDYYFSRSYGNLTNNLSNEIVPAVKYLTAFLGYACIKWLLEKRTIPNMNFTSMCDLYLPSLHLDFLKDVWQKQKNLNVERNSRFHTLELSTHNLFTITAQAVDNSITMRGKSTLYQEKIAVVNRNDNFNNWLRQELEKVSDKITQIAESEKKIIIKKGNTAFLFNTMTKYWKETNEHEEN